MNSAFAADEYGRGVYTARDSEIGEMTVTVRDIGETVDTMKIEVLCYDRRTRTHTVRPELEVISLSRDKSPTIPVCYFRERNDLYNKETKILTVHYSQLAEGPGGQARCALHQVTTINMRSWCSRFQPGN